jgi:hypothetical protein
MLQKERFSEAWYPEAFVRDQSIILTKKMRKTNSTEVENDLLSVSFPYHHNLSPRLKSDVKDLGIELGSSIKDKLESLPRQVEKKKETCKIGKSHPKFIDCSNKVVYKIPLNCGNSYIGQTDKCANIRLEQHKKETGKDEGNSFKLCEHLKKCKGCFAE